MGSNKEIKAYKEALEQSLNDEFKGYFISVFKRLDDKFKLPAIIVNPPKFVPTGSVNTPSKTMLNAICDAFVCFSVADEENELECVQTSADLASFINKKNWGVKCITPAVVDSVNPVCIDGLEDLVIGKVRFNQNIAITRN